MKEKVSKIIHAQSIGSDTYTAVIQFGARSTMGIVLGRENDPNFHPGKSLRYEKNGKVIATQSAGPDTGVDTDHMFNSISYLDYVGAKYLSVGVFTIDCTISKLNIHIDLPDNILFIHTNYLTQDQYNNAKENLIKIASKLDLTVKHSIGGIGDFLNLAVEDLQ